MVLTVLSHHRLLLILTSFLQSTAKWLANHQASDSLALTFEATWPQMTDFMDQVLLVELNHLLLDHLLQLGHVRGTFLLSFRGGSKSRLIFD